MPADISLLEENVQRVIAILQLRRDLNLIDQVVVFFFFFFFFFFFKKTQHYRKNAMPASKNTGADH